jgi:hypothetical protein
MSTRLENALQATVAAINNWSGATAGLASAQVELDMATAARALATQEVETADASAQTALAELVAAAREQGIELPSPISAPAS